MDLKIANLKVENDEGIQKLYGGRKRMKKLINVGKVILLAVIFVVGTTNICFADTYISLTDQFIWNYSDFICIIEIILAVLFIISLVCMIIGKIGKLDNLLSKSKKICENLFY